MTTTNHLRRWFRERGIGHRIARKGVESSQRLGRRRRKAEHLLALVGMAAALIRYRRLTK
jgi:hypothetical protein